MCSKHNSYWRFITNIARIKAWKELVDTNFQSYLITILYILIVNNLFTYSLIPSICILALSLALYVSYTFILNDYCDMPYDQRAGKWRAVHELPTPFVTGLIAGLFSTGFLVILFCENILFSLIYALAYFMSTFYSAPPIRFKVRGVLGALVDMIVEKSLPILLVFTFFNYFFYDTLIFIFLFSVLQLKLIMDHQVYDYRADVASGTKTLVVKIGPEKANRILNLFIRPLFVVIFIIFSIVMYIRIPFSFLVLAPIFLGYFAVRTLLSKNMIRRVNIRSDSGWQVERIPFYDGYISASLPVILLFLAFFIALKYPHYIFLLAMAVASQIYVIKGHYLRLVDSIVKVFF